MIIKNTTLQNKSKSARLSGQHQIPHHHVANRDVVRFLQELDLSSATKETILYSLALELTRNNPNPHLIKVKEYYKTKIVSLPVVPKEAFDLLGSTYQFLSSKSENLELGAFYTGPQIASDFVHDLDFSSGETIIDPACGSGMFLFQSKAKPENIYGVDYDPVAVMLAKFNFFIKFPNAGAPNIFHADFFDWVKGNSQRFNYVVGNPPYGASLDKSKIDTTIVRSGESFSYFIESSLKLLQDTGTMRFLVPESLLNVKRHEDIRGFLLTDGNLRLVKKYPKKFSGVMSDLFQIELSNIPCSNVLFYDSGVTDIPKTALTELAYKKIVYLTNLDLSIISKLKSISSTSLKGSVFGLGVVTGDNKTKLFQDPQPGTEPIYTGKEVFAYYLSEPKWHLYFDREKLQQVAPEEVYRSEFKLVYKTITKKLVFALDKTRSLTSNSANIVIPHRKLDPIAMCVLLNTPLYTYMHMKLSGGVNKVGRENLELLPIPDLSAAQVKHLKTLYSVQDESNKFEQAMKYVHETIFELEEPEISHIMAVVGSI